MGARFIFVQLLPKDDPFVTRIKQIHTFELIVEKNHYLCTAIP